MNNEQATQTTVSTVQERPLWRAFSVFLAPMILANLLQGLSGTMNALSFLDQ